MESQNNTVLFMAHRFQRRNQILQQLMDDVVLRLPLKDFNLRSLTEFDSIHAPASTAYFYDYCYFCLEQLTKVSGDHEGTLSILNLVIVYWKNNDKFQGLKSDEITALLKALIDLQAATNLNPFLNDQVKSLLASRLHLENQLDEALEMQQAVVNTRQSELGDQDLATAESAFRLADCYKAKGLIQAAHDGYGLALRGFEKNLGTRHEQTKLCMTKYARTCELLGEIESAKDLYQRIYAINKNQLGPSHVLTLLNMRRLAACHIEQSQFIEASRLFQRLNRLCSKAFGPNHAYTISSVIDLGVCRVGMGEYRSAEVLFLDVLGSIEQCSQCGDAEKVNVYVNLARCYAFMNLPEKVDHYFQLALNLSENQLGTQHEDTYLCVKNMAIYYQNIGDHQRAEEMFLYALAVAEGCHRNHVARLVEIRYALSKLYREIGRAELAELVLSGALRQLGDQKLAKGSLLTKIERTYLNCLEEQGKYRETLSKLSEFIRSSISNYASTVANKDEVEGLVNSLDSLDAKVSLNQAVDKSSYLESLSSVTAMAVDVDKNLGAYIRNLYTNVENNASL